MNTIEEELRAAFRQGSEQLPPTTDPWSRTNRAIARSRARRRAAGVGSVALAAVAAVVVTTSPLPLLRGEPPANRNGQTATTDGAIKVAVRPGQGKGPAVTGVELEKWPTRGSLSDRTDLLAQVRAHFTAERAAVLSVPYLGEVDGVAVAVVVADTPAGGTGGTVMGPRLVYGAAGTPVSRWKVAPVEQVGRPEPGAVTVVLHGEDGIARVVAVTLSRGATVKVSPQPSYAAEATPVHRYVNVPLENGVGVATFRARSIAGVSIATDIGAAGTSGPRSTAPTLRASAFAHTALDANAFAQAAAGPSCRGAVTPEGLATLVGAVLDRHGLGLSDVAVRTVWCRTTAAGAATVVAVTAKDGTTFQSAGFVRKDTKDGIPEAVVNGRPVPQVWKGDAPMAFTPAPGEGEDPDPVPVFVSAPGAATVELTADVDGLVEVRARVDADGFALLSVPKDQWEPLWETGDIHVKDASGRQIKVAPVQQQARDLDPMGLYPEGTAG